MKKNKTRERKCSSCVFANIRYKSGAPVPRPVQSTPCSKRPKINRQTGEKCNVYDRRRSSRRSRKRLLGINDRFSQASSCYYSVAALSVTSSEDTNIKGIHEAYAYLSLFINEYMFSTSYVPRVSCVNHI